MGESNLVYISPFSLLVIVGKGKLIRLHCPFIVQAITSDYGLVPEQKYPVTLVRNDPLLLMLYRIGDRFYPFSAFRILSAESLRG